MAAANGRETSVGAIDVAGAAREDVRRRHGAVSLLQPFSVVWAKRSRAKPVTRTLSPTFGVLALPVKTKIPSEVAVLPSPGRILDVEAAVGSRALEVADDHALGADDAGGRSGSAAALDRVDRRERVAAGGGVVIDDRALSLPVGDRGAGHVRDVDEERLVGSTDVSPLTRTSNVVLVLPAEIVWAVSGFAV